MNKTTCFNKWLLSTLLINLLIISSIVPVYADSMYATSYYNSVNTTYGANNKVSSRVYYSANSSTSITITKLAVAVINNGTIDVNSGHFVAYSSTQSSYQQYEATDFPSIGTGQTATYTVNWSTVCYAHGTSNTYSKSGGILRARALTKTSKADWVGINGHIIDCLQNCSFTAQHQ